MNRIREMFSHMREETYYTIGFGVFDLLHLACGVFFLVKAYLYMEGNWEMEAASAITEIGMAILLLTFVSTLVVKSESPVDASQHYSYCWLIASSSVILPEIFMIPYFYSEKSYISSAIGITILLVASAAFLLFFISVFETTNRGIWRVMDWIGLALFFAVGPLLIASHITEGETGASLAFGILHGLAPMVPAVMSAIDFVRVAKKRKQESQAE